MIDRFSAVAQRRALLAGLLTVALGHELTLSRAFAQADVIHVTGVVRDFRRSHVDFDVVPPQGYGHYVANVEQTLPVGAPGRCRLASARRRIARRGRPARRASAIKPAAVPRKAMKVPAAPIHDVAEALANPFVTEHGRLLQVNGADGRSYRTVAPPFRCAGDALLAKAAPELGDDTTDILTELGYDTDRIAALRDSKVI